MTQAEKLEALVRSKYKITRDGSIINRRTDRTVQGSIDRNGYRYIAVYSPDTGKQYKVKAHRIVAWVYLPNPSGLPFINHKDGNPLNNRVENLEWCTPQYNVIDGFRRGRTIHNKGVKRVEPRSCLHCGNEFTPEKSRVMTCNKSCAAKLRTSQGRSNPHRNSVNGRFAHA